MKNLKHARELINTYLDLSNTLLLVNDTYEKAGMEDGRLRKRKFKKARLW